MVTTVGPTYHRRSGTVCLRSEPRLYAAAAAVWFPVTRVGRGWAGQDELGKIQSECKSVVILTMTASCVHLSWQTSAEALQTVRVQGEVAAVLVK